MLLAVHEENTQEKIKKETKNIISENYKSKNCSHFVLIFFLLEQQKN